MLRDSSTPARANVHGLRLHDQPSTGRPGGVPEGVAGHLQADAFAGYDGIYAGGQVRQVLCWAHARRKFFEARTVQLEPAYVRGLLVQYSGAPATDLSGLVPDHWLQTHPESRRRWSR